MPTSAGVRDVGAIELFLQYPFLQHALIAGILVATLAAVLGVPLILREMAMFGHGFAHVSYAGVALGFFFSIYPLGAALGLTVVAAVVVQLLRSRGILTGDTALAIVVSMGFALGVVIVSLAGGFTTDLSGYLFGNLFAVTRQDALLMGVAGALLLGVFVGLYKEMFYLTFDEPSARISGLPVDLLNVLYISLTAATIVLASRIVGLLLVASLLVIPAATGLQVTKTFRGAMFASVGFGVLATVLGMYLAAEFDLATGGTIVLTAGTVFGLVALGSRAGDQ